MAKKRIGFIVGVIISLLALSFGIYFLIKYSQDKAGNGPGPGPGPGPGTTRIN